ncbi:MAG: hypothetical protein HQK88_13475 [Nitrospirae bacterium]|nr:hypothetical protein [Nitrospirota bacterium]MBF0535853.1 hypothetical protein [Nitrospirota bacterium]MBF0617813.1 hypothetical protein [Nitrospirota bacterium]
MTLQAKENRVILDICFNKRIDLYHIVTIAVFPIILLTLNNKWIFTNAFFIYVDPWIYLGYFLDFSGHLNAFKSYFYTNYFGTRFPWIVPGILAYKVFPPLTANYVLHLGFLYTALFSAYFIIKNVLDKNSALFTTILLGCYSYFLFSLGWDYVDGAEITYLLLIILCLVNLKKTNEKLLLGFFTGFFYALLLYTNLYMIIYTPTFLIFFFYGNKALKTNFDFVKLATWISISFLLVTISFCILNYAVSGQILFFLPQIKVALDLSLGYHRWKQPFAVWLFNAGHLVIPVIAFFINLILLFYSFFRKTNEKNITLLRLLYVLSFIMAVIFELLKKPVLQQMFYASNLIPFLFLSIATWFYPFLEKLNSKQMLLVVVCSIATLLIPFGLYSDEGFIYVMIRYRRFILLFIFIAGSFFIYITSKTNRYVAYVLFFCLSFSVINYLSSFREVFQNTNNPERESAHIAVVKTIEYLKEINPDCEALFWYNSETDPMGRMFRAVNSAYMWRYRRIGTEFPKIEKNIHPDNSTKIVFLTSNNEDYENAVNSLKNVNYKAKLVSLKTIKQDNINFSIYFLAYGQN